MGQVLRGSATTNEAIRRAIQARQESVGAVAKRHGVSATPIHESARQMVRDIAVSEEGRTSRRERKKVEMLFAHLKRILKLDRLRLRGPNGARDEFHLAAAAQNLRKLAKFSVPPLPSPA